MKKITVILGLLMLLSGCSQQAANQEPVKVVEKEKVNVPSETAAPEFEVSGKVIVIDAGHGVTAEVKKEAIAPGSSEMKNAYVSGTSGKNQTEEELNLAVAKKLQAVLEERGAEIYMTRTEHECTVSNIERAEFANGLNADISVKIHADGVNDASVRGVSVLVPGNQYISDENVIAQSRKAGEYILASFVSATGAKDRGISVRNDMTGFNWSRVPVVLVEMGFMTNPEEDALMETEEYQNKMVQGIADGLESYFE